MGSLVTGTTAMGQLQRSLDRLYGVEQDRSTPAKYRLAVGLTLTAGTAMTLAFGAVAFGNVIGDAVGDGLLTTLWAVPRIPIALALLLVAMAVLLRRCPRRLALNVMFGFISSFGDAYGPLAGIVALMIWSLASSLGLLYGASVAAELESFRSLESSVAGTAADDVVASALGTGSPVVAQQGRQLGVARAWRGRRRP